MYVTSLSSVPIFQQLQHMEFTFYNSYDILGLVPSTLIFWTKFSCWHKHYTAPRLKSSLQ